MNKTERKNKLNEFMVKITECISDLKDARNKESKLKSKIDELNAMTDDYSLGENLFDVDKMYSAITVALIESTQFHEISEELSEYQSDLNEYISELSEEKAEELEDTYSKWENLIEFFDVSGEDIIDDVIVKLEEALDWLKDRIKEKVY